jgi:predicted RNA-binding Zn ribbon-like protein
MRSIACLQLDGGCPVFDFTNTISNRNDPDYFDYLTKYNDFIQWSEKIGLLSKGRIHAISIFSESHVRKSADTLRQVVEAREVIFTLFSSLAQHRKADKGAMDAFNGLLSEALSNMRIDVGRTEVTTSFAVSEKTILKEPLYLLIKNAFDILSSQSFERIKECPTCRWLFLDTTKNGKRRWCNMQVCGSNDKARRYYHRKKESTNPA